MNSKGASNIQVYIAAHVPPGVFELNPETNWFHDDFNDAYMDIVENYADVILAHFYGHEHFDSLRIGESPGNGSSSLQLQCCHGFMTHSVHMCFI